MKKQLFTFLLLLSGIGQVFAQSKDCGFFFDKASRDSLLIFTTIDYTLACQKEHISLVEKGIIMLTIYKDDKGRTCWSYKTRVDDRYQDNPPLKWTMVWNYVVLVYEGVDGSVFAKDKKTNASPEQAKCLEEAIGDRVYKRPTEKKRKTILVEKDGSWRIGPDPTITYRHGNDSNNMIYVFEKDGKVTKVTPY